ncbi:unnamed protein product [Ambrosiozyma monospora]|uniref:Unnamed protein product n=1 Tax=Ambrosiozyma monospora TaxID=43982 RepID=A0A9W7DFQ9_AMBMO|nr:unnamed protein product [Ambrosiozyma monospora]
MKLPEDYKASLLVHNGTNTRIFSLFHSHDYISHKQVIQEWEDHKCTGTGTGTGTGMDPEDDVESDVPEFKGRLYWYTKWIPFTDDGFGQHYFVDLNPTSKGTVGQVGSFDRDVGVDELLAGSFYQFFSNYVRDVYCGKYRVEKWGLSNIDYCNS